MSNILVINASGPETRVALVENGTISEFYLERKKEKGIVGNIYKGKVVRVLPGMQAAFVDIGLEKAAFLYVADVAGGPDFSEEFDLAEVPEGEHGEPPEGEVPSEEEAERAAAEGASRIIETTATLVDESSEAEKAPSKAEIAQSDESTEASPVETTISTRPEADTVSAADTATADSATDSRTDSEQESESAVEAGAVAVSADADPESDEGPVSGAAEASDSEEQASSDVAAESLVGTKSDVEAGADDHARSDVDAKSEAGAPRTSSEETREGPEAGSGSDVSATRSDAAQEEAADEDRGEGSEDVSEESEEDDDTDRSDEADEADDEDSDDPEDGESEDESEDDEESDTDTDSDDESDAEDEEDASAEAEAGNGGRRHREGRGRRRGRDKGTRGAVRAPRVEPLARKRRRNGATPDPVASVDPQKGKAQIQDLLKEGQEVIVQVVKDPIGTKGARVTCHISLPGRHLVFMPTVDHVGISRRIEAEKERRRLRELVDALRPPGTGFIVRTVADGVERGKLEADIRFLLGLWNDMARRKDQLRAPALLHPDLDLILRSIRDLFSAEVEKLVIDDRDEYERVVAFVEKNVPHLRDSIQLYEGAEPIFDAYGIEQELTRAMSRKVWLKSGGYLIIDQAEALVAIDINSGRFVGKKNLEETITQINIEAAKEIVYQLRLRNIGGIIIIDFIDMEKQANRDKVLKALQEALQRDRAKTNIVKISELGLVEMTRKRVRESVNRLLQEPCSYCDGHGFLKSKATVAYEIFREIHRESMSRREDTIVVSCHPDVARFITQDERESLRHLMMRFNKTVQVKPQSGYHQEQYDLTARWSKRDEGAGQKQGGGSSRQAQSSRRTSRGATAAQATTPAERAPAEQADSPDNGEASSAQPSSASRRRRRRRRRSSSATGAGSDNGNGVGAEGRSGSEGASQATAAPVDTES